MIVGRWTIVAKFGHKQEVVEACKTWMQEFGNQIGWTRDKVRITTGSIGELESAVISEVTLPDLATLHQSWEKLASLPGHSEWSKKIEPHIVSGTNRWEVLRVL